MNLYWVVSVVVSVSVVAVLLAVAMSFASRNPQSEKTEKPSPVATLTMLLFFGAFYLTIRFRFGQVAVEDPVALVLAIIGLPLVVVGAVVNIFGRLHLGKNWADQATVYTDQTLIRTGLYRWIRHPLYASLIWMFIGAALAYHNGISLGITCLVFIPAMIWRATLEEKMLMERFPEYSDYRLHTGRLIPWRRKEVTHNGS